MDKPKYFHVEWNGWDNVASGIKDNKKLAIWLKDGSLEEDDEIFQVSKKFKVIKSRDGKLRIQEVENK